MTTNFMTITIDGIDVSKYSEYYVLNHITKKTEPKRSEAFTMTNINDIVQVEVPEIYVRFKYLPIDLYRTIFKATRKTEFRVDYYDQDYDMIRSNMFYVKDPSSLKPHAWGGKYYGFKDYELNLICTMNPISTLELSLKDVEESLLSVPYILEVKKGSNVNFLVGTLLNNVPIKSLVEISFSNDLFVLGGTYVTKNDGNIYKVTTLNNDYSFVTIYTSMLKYIGEYVMFLTLKDENYGSSTISCIVKVTE